VTLVLGSDVAGSVWHAAGLYASVHAVHVLSTWKAVMGHKWPPTNPVQFPLNLQPASAREKDLRICGLAHQLVSVAAIDLVDGSCNIAHCNSAAAIGRLLGDH
jgi:hypothetical protein